MSAKEMNHLERFRAVMNFQEFDRLPRIEWAVWWNKTIDRWIGEGLPTVTNVEHDRYFGLDPYYQKWFFSRLRPTPRPPGHTGSGAVANMEEYQWLKSYLYPAPDIHLADMTTMGLAQKAGNAVCWLTLDGFFWWPRMLLGIERHLYSFYDQAELMHTMNSDLADYHVSVLKWVSKICPPAFITVAEDMTYNLGPMISKDLFTEFMAPYYRKIIPILKEMGTFIIIDSDGDVTDLMPWMLELGIDGILPLERQAGCDAAKLRSVLPTVRMIGHYDKLTMDKGEEAMRAEFERLLPVMRTGGFIPSVDHQTHPGVSLDQYRIYLRLLREYTEKAAK